MNLTIEFNEQLSIATELEGKMIKKISDYELPTTQVGNPNYNIIDLTKDLISEMEIEFYPETDEYQDEEWFDGSRPITLKYYGEKELHIYRTNKNKTENEQLIKLGRLFLWETQNEDNSGTN